jgi:hypothetical protein
MDLREIERLHGQFSTEPFTYGLAARIAALPAPRDLAIEDAKPSRGGTSRRARRVVKLGAIAVSIAAVVAAAGMGAASLYTRWNAAPVGTDAPVAAVASTNRASAPPDAASSVATLGDAEQTREINASIGRPVTMSPSFDPAEHAAAMPQGMTAEEFRHVVTQRSPEAARTTASTASNEAQLAVTSPIRRPATTRPAEVKGVTVTSGGTPEPMVAQPVVASPVADQHVVAATLTPTAPAAAVAPAITPVAPDQNADRLESKNSDTPAVATKPVHSSTRHFAKERAQAPESSPATAKTQVAPPHVETNEVRMF